VKQPPSEVARIVHTERAPAFVVEIFYELDKHCRCHCWCSMALDVVGFRFLFTYNHSPSPPLWLSPFSLSRNTHTVGYGCLNESPYICQHCTILQVSAHWNSTSFLHLLCPVSPAGLSYRPRISQ
jgi:hypothetical protein